VSGPQRVLIVGGSIAGWTTATSLRDGGFSGELVVIEREPACYDRPPLSKTALVDDAALDSLAYADPAKIAELRIDLRCGTTVTALDVPGSSVALDDGTRLTGEAIVLATGALARPPSFPGAELPGVGTLRNYADVARLRALVGRRVAVVGGGLIGAEAAAALRLAGSEVVLIDPNEAPAARAFGPTMAAHLQSMHAEHGVATRVGSVVAVTAVEDGLEVELTAGEPVRVDGVLVGTGVVLETDLAQRAGLEVDSGIVVDEAGRTSARGVYAVGDATIRRLPSGLAAPCGHWDAARLDGVAVAAAILGRTPDPRGADWFWSDRYDHHVEVVGDMTAGETEVVRAGAHPTVFRLDGDRMIAAASVDDPMTVRAARRLIDHAVPVNADQLKDPGVQLRSLLPRA